MKRLIICSYLWATVLALGVWDYYIIKYPPCNLPRIYQEMLMPVVRITCLNGVGSGVVISRQKAVGSRQRDKTDYRILTAAHVVGNQSKVQVHIYDYELGVITIKSANVIITDTYKDLALLRINGTPRMGRDSSVASQINAGHRDIIRTAKLAPKDYKPRLFTEVYAVGCSLGLAPRPSSGIISAEQQRSPVPYGVPYYEISAPILPGNSGGGVFLKGTHELIGIVVWVRTYHGQLVTSMAGIVPINAIYEFLDNAPVSNYIPGGVRTRTGPERLIGLTLMFPREGQAKRSPYLRKAARKTPKCNPLGTQHSEGGELTWQQ